MRRNNNFMCIKTEVLKLLDITNYLAPGFSYSQFLKAYECTEMGFFPYEWMTSYYQNQNVDIFKDGINVSRLILKYMFQDLPDYFTLPDEKNKDLYQMYKNNIVGGPSIVSSVP